MRADLLHVLTAVANPIRWRSRTALFHRFAEHVLASGARLTVVECAFGERPHELGGDPRYRHVPVRARTLLWTKENLLDLGLQHLPDDWKYVAWIDADVTFRRPDWAAETVQALQQYDIVQPWSDCYDLGPHDEHLQVHESFAKLWCAGRPIVPAGPYAFGHPGYAWAATRPALDWTGGLIETAALGAADHHMAMALLDRAAETYPAQICEGYRLPILQWQARASRHIAGNLGVVAGTIEHGWHGAKAKRFYQSRWDILVRNHFDPATDLKRNSWGVLELAGNKPQLRRDIDAYFRARDEDSNTLG